MTYITKWDGNEFKKLKDVKIHIEILNDKDRSKMIGCPVLEKRKKSEETTLIGYITMQKDQCIIRKKPNL